MIRKFKILILWCSSYLYLSFSSSIFPHNNNQGLKGHLLLHMKGDRNVWGSYTGLALDLSGCIFFMVIMPLQNCISLKLLFFTLSQKVDIKNFPSCHRWALEKILPPHAWWLHDIIYTRIIQGFMSPFTKSSRVSFSTWGLWPLWELNDRFRDHLRSSENTDIYTML